MINSEMYSFSSKLWYNKRRVQNTGEVSLYLQATVNRAHKEFPLKLKWPAEKIDLVKGELFPRRKRDPDVDDYNLLIRTEQGKHNEILRLYRLRNAFIDISIFSREVRTFDQKESFMGYMSKQILYRYNVKEIEKRTFQNHRAAQKLMLEFSDSWLYQEVDVKMLKRFKLFLQNKEFKPGKKYSPGHVWSVMRTLKAYLKFASAEPLIYVNQEVVDFPNPMPKWETTFLNKDEVRYLMILYRSGNTTDIENQVLRAFLFTCFTSLRISDVYRVNASWKITANHLHFIPKKNEKKQKWITVPIMNLATHFVKNDAGTYFELPSEQEYNRTLKDIAAKAGIRKKLTSHVGRHTYGYLFMTTVGNLKALQEILGHSKSETTDRYAHLDEEYKLDAVNRIETDFIDLVGYRKREPA